MHTLNKLIKFSLNKFVNNEIKKSSSFFNLNHQFMCRYNSLSQYQLLEVGILADSKSENYKTGQVFLHKLFGYRGVILFPWTANVFDKNDESSKSDMTSSQYDKQATDELLNAPPERNKAKQLTYYQVLIDNRDIPYVRAHTEAITFLSGPQSNRSVYSITGLDYVSHNDVLPYKSTEKTPIVHDLFEKFFLFDPKSTSLFSAKDNLKAWQDSNHPWLELSDICIRVTQNIKVTVIPFYIGVKEDQKKKLYWWRYSIRIENLTPTKPVILRERHWRVFSQAGTYETVKGKGVVGQEPHLNSDYPVFQYSSHVNLQAPSGHMWGTFIMEREDGGSFEARIPSFHLECKEEDKTKN